jgi:hypothetical protein
MEIKKWTILFEGRPAKAEVYLRDGHGWDMKFEGIDPAQHQLRPGLSKAQAVDCLVQGYKRNCWDIADEELKANPPAPIPIDPGLLKAMEKAVEKTLEEFEAKK